MDEMTPDELDQEIRQHMKNSRATLLISVGFLESNARRLADHCECIGYEAQVLHPLMKDDPLCLLIKWATLVG
jgi:hypothetical protein